MNPSHSSKVPPQKTYVLGSETRVYLPRAPSTQPPGAIEVPDAPASAPVSDTERPYANPIRSK